MNEIVNHKFEALCKNFYHDMYDIIEQYNLTNEEAFVGLATNISMISISTFKEDTPKFVEILSKMYAEMGSEVLDEMKGEEK